MTRAIQRRARRTIFLVNGRPPSTIGLNDEEFEILESGIISDETLDPGWSRHRTTSH